MLPTDHKDRKEFPLLTVLTAYFPDAIEALVGLCKQGNVQHNVGPDVQNPFALEGDRIMWDRSKSTDQMETLMRHTWDHMRAKRGVGSLVDTDGQLHMVKAFWRAGAELQLTIEALRAGEVPALAGSGTQLPTDDGDADRRPDTDINGASPSDPLPVMLPVDPDAGWTRGMPVPRGRYVGPNGQLNVPPTEPLYRDLPPG